MPTDAAPVDVTADQERQVLQMRFQGSVSASDFRAVVEPAEVLLKSLQPGFTVVTDLTGLDSMDINCVRDLTRLMDEFLKAGAARVIRIIPEPDKDIGFGLLSLTHYRGRIPVATFATRAEARHALD